jgi:hypothetical protein
MTMKNCTENDVRVKNPKDGIKADYEGSRSAAIEIFCTSCFGGSRSDARNCKSYVCPLWRYRPGSDKSEAPNGHIPSKTEYETLINKLEVSDGRVAQGKRLAELRKKSTS